MKSHIEYSDLDFFDAIGAIVDDCLANPEMKGFIHVHNELDNWINFRIDLKIMMAERFGILTVKDHDHCVVITFNNTSLIVVSCTVTGGDDEEFAKQYLPMALRSQHFQVGVMYPKMDLLRSMVAQMHALREFRPKIYNVVV